MGPEVEADLKIVNSWLCNWVARSGVQYADEWNRFRLDNLVLEKLRKSSTTAKLGYHSSGDDCFWNLPPALVEIPAPLMITMFFFALRSFFSRSICDKPSIDVFEM